MVIRIHHVLYRIGTSCTNCGVRRPTNGLCSRCLDLPYCKVCKRHLENNCFNEVQRNICQVHLQIVLFLHVTSYVFYIPVQVGLLFHISLSLHVLSSVYVYRTVKNDTLNDALHSITSCLKLRYPWPDTTHHSKHLSTHVNTPSRTSFETPYSSTGILTHLFFCSL